MSQDQRSAGSILKEARIDKKISVELVSKGTRIHVNVIRALENDDFKKLGTVYAKNFLKLYAEYLGLDKEDILRRFQETLTPEDVRQAKKITFPEAEPRRDGPRLSFNNFKSLALTIKPLIKKINYKILVGIILGILLLAGITRLIGCRRQQKPGAWKEIRVKKPVVNQSSQPKPSIKKAPLKPAASATSSTASQKSAKKDEKILLVVRAKQRCWLQVKVDGKIVFQSVLDRGAAETWQAKEKIELWLGNAGGVELELNGRVLEKIGRPGQMLKNVLVTRNGLSL